MAKKVRVIASAGGPGLVRSLQSLGRVVSVDPARPAPALANLLRKEKASVYVCEGDPPAFVPEACANAKVKKIVLVSSTLRYGASPLNPSFIGEDALAPEIRFAGGLTILRAAPVVGPTVDNWVARFLTRKLVPLAWGYDPLVQLLHEDDLAAAIRLAVNKRTSGVFNLAGDGVLPLSSVYRLIGARRVPVPSAVARVSSRAALLRWPCVADTRRAKDALGFHPRMRTKDALLDFVQTVTLRRIAA